MSLGRGQESSGDTSEYCFCREKRQRSREPSFSLVWKGGQRERRQTSLLLVKEDFGSVINTKKPETEGKVVVGPTSFVRTEIVHSSDHVALTTLGEGTYSSERVFVEGYSGEGGG